MLTLFSVALPQAASAHTLVSNATPSSLTPSQNLPAFAQEKQQLAEEYIGMLAGKESLAQYEKHHLAFMQKWNLGGTNNLHKALTMTRKQAVMASAGVSAASCPQVAGSPKPDSVSPNGCPIPVSAVAFPEEFPNYCGHATLSTVLVEDSFKWTNANVYDNGSGYIDTISYDPYHIAQPASTALLNEDMLAGKPKYELLNTAPRDSNTNPNDIADGTDYTQMVRIMNFYVLGKGGYYNPERNMSKFQNDLIVDANQGWDLAVGLSIPANATPVLPGWPVNNSKNRGHWLTAAYYSNAGATTEIADPVSNASVYFSNHGYNVSGIPPHENISTSALMSQSFVFIW